MSNRIDTNVPRPRVDPQYDGLPSGGADGPAVSDRTARTLAVSRLDEFFEGGGVRTGIQCDFKEHHDFALCGTDPVTNSVLFLKESGDADAVDFKDVRQQALGDCHIMAALAALARTPAGASAIKSMISVGTNQYGEVAYTVTLHRPEHHWFGKTTFTEVQVTVDGPYVQGHAVPREKDSLQEVWPLVMEKALAKLYGGYAEINRGRSPALALEVLTGQPVESRGLGWLSSYSPRDLTAALGAGKVVVLSTRESLSSSNSMRLVANHAYAVVGVAIVGDQRCLLLRNPWGTAQPAPVPVDELDDWFSAVDVGSVR
jgi:hypothetical protein